MEILPRVIEEITPTILEKSQELINASVENKIKADEDKEKLLTEGLKIMERNRGEWNKLLDIRETKYGKLVRARSLVSLYEEGMQESPIYVPRKFREDKMAIKSHKEVHVIHKMNVQRSQAEIEILQIRTEAFHEDVEKMDAEIHQKFELRFFDLCEIRDF